MRLIPLFTALLIVCAGALAEDYTWTGAAGTGTTGDWSDGGNWEDSVGGTGVVPGAGDNATINVWITPDPYALNIDVDTALLNNLSIALGKYLNINGPGTINVDGTITTSGGGVPEWGEGVYVNTSLSGPAGIDHITGGMWMNAANTITGPVNIAPIAGQYRPYVYAWADGCLGSGTVTIHNSPGRLYNEEDQSHGPLVVKTGGYALYAPRYDNQGARTASATTYTIDGGTLVGNFDFPAGASITIQNNGTFGGATNGNWGRTFAIDSTVTMLSDMTFRPGAHIYNSINWNGQIVGNGHTITVVDSNTNYTSSHDLDVHLTNVTQGFDGNWVIQQGVISVDADGALGVGSSVTVDKQSRYARLQFTTAQTSVPALTAQNGGLIRIEYIGNFDHAVNLTTAGQLEGRAGTAGAGYAVMGGAVNLASEGVLATVGNNSDNTLEVTGAVNGGASALLTINSAGPNAPVILNHDNSATFSGEVEVVDGLLSVAATGGLGSGTATAKGGIIRSDIDGAFNSPSSVTADEGGTIDLNSTETAQVHILQSGAFKVSGGATVLNYTKTTGNIQVYEGCVLDQNLGIMGGFPSIGDFNPGDGGHGAFVSATTGNWTVGPGTIWRGLAISPDVSATFDGTVNEAAGGSDGIGFLAMSGATWNYNNSTLTTQGTNTIKLYGPGGHVIKSGNTFNNAIDMLGTGMVGVSSAGDMSGETLNVKSGRLVADGAELEGAAVNIESGGIIHMGSQMTNTTGLLTVKNGGAVHYTKNQPKFNADPARTQLDEGCQIFVWHYHKPPAGDMPGAGIADYVISGTDGRWHSARIDAGVMRLGDNTRLTFSPNWYESTVSDRTIGEIRAETTGYVGLAADQSQCRLSSPYLNGDGQLQVNCPVDLTGSGTEAGNIGKLIVGDPNPYSAINHTATGMETHTHDGLVLLGDDANVIGSIEIQAGMLRVDEAAQLGGASVVDIKEPGTLYLYNSMELGCALTGDGTIDSRGSDRTLTLRAGSISPGASAGDLTLNGQLDFAKDIADPFDQLLIDITGPDAVAGSDYDQLIVSGNVTNLINAELVVNIDPALTQADLENDVLTILTCGNDVSSELFGSVVWSAGWDGTVNYGVGLIELSEIGVGLPPPGDATGEGCVDGADYTAWADHYGETGLATYSDGGWTVGNWNDDTTVDGADYTAWADNYGTGCGSTVPEPVTLSLLALGACLALLRRRR